MRPKDRISVSTTNATNKPTDKKIAEDALNKKLKTKAKEGGK